MRLFGRGRYATGAYPQPPIGGAAVAALTNRYQVAAAPGIPSAFTSTTGRIVAALNVERKASGIFVVMINMISELGAANTQTWSVFAIPGGVASGGVASGDWLIDDNATITPSSVADPIGVCVAEIQSSTGNLRQTLSLSGTNLTPLGTSGGCFIMLGLTQGGGSLISPGALLATAFELP